MMDFVTLRIQPDNQGQEKCGNVIADHLSGLTKSLLLIHHPSMIHSLMNFYFLYTIYHGMLTLLIVLQQVKCHNYLTTSEMPSDWNSQVKKKFLADVKNFY